MPEERNKKIKWNLKKTLLKKYHSVTEISFVIDEFFSTEIIGFYSK